MCAFHSELDFGSGIVEAGIRMLSYMPHVMKKPMVQTSNHKEKVSCDSMGLFSVVVTGKSTFGMLSRWRDILLVFVNSDNSKPPWGFRLRHGQLDGILVTANRLCYWGCHLSGDESVVMFSSLEAADISRSPYETLLVSLRWVLGGNVSSTGMTMLCNAQMGYPQLLRVWNTWPWRPALTRSIMVLKPF